MVAFDIDDFCLRAGISKQALYGRWKRGTGPARITATIEHHHRVLIPFGPGSEWLVEHARKRVRREVQREFQQAGRGRQQ